MADINTVILVGRLVRDAELKYTNSGLAICEFAIAVDNRRKQGNEWVDEANFFDITLFGRQGEAIQRYLVKGKQVGVNGQLRQDRWQTPEGQNRSKVGVVAHNIMLLGGSSSSTGTSSNYEKQSSSNADKENAPAASNDDFEDNIPF